MKYMMIFIKKWRWDYVESINIDFSSNNEIILEYSFQSKIEFVINYIEVTEPSKYEYPKVIDWCR